METSDQNHRNLTTVFIDDSNQHQAQQENPSTFSDEDSSVRNDPFLAVAENNADLEFDLDDLSSEEGEEGEFELLPALDFYLLPNDQNNGNRKENDNLTPKRTDALLDRPSLQESSGTSFTYHNYYPLSAVTKDLDGVSVPTDKESIDNLLATEMSQLSMKEKESIYFELHGLTDPIKETPCKISQALKDFDDILLAKELEHAASGDNSSNNEIEEYLLAKSIDTRFTENLKLRLQFIRATRYEVDESVRRFLKYFSSKLELFGKKSFAVKSNGMIYHLWIKRPSVHQICIFLENEI